ncbi:hypothetical protein RRG08_009559 [Elysia crispata]|uniref:Uncharacterized protein n=1 Tax=Elysia crispata TaxID=231223 RepID=A0AAE0ZJ59_9GAST|nr:hypothetical protein RRG08_009559 [Elysia crispata]
MKSVIAAVILLMACHARCDKVCQAPQSEAVYYWTGSNWDFYVVNDYDQGLVLKVSGDDPNGDRWVLANVKTGVVYLNTPEGGCHYQQFLPEHIELFYQCLPENAELVRSGFLDFYYMPTNGAITFLAGMKALPDTDYYVRHFSRYQSDIVEESLTYSVLYKFSMGISDPTVLDKDLSVCVEGPLDENLYYVKDYVANKA